MLLCCLCGYPYEFFAVVVDRMILFVLLLLLLLFCCVCCCCCCCYAAVVSSSLMLSLLQLSLCRFPRLPVRIVALAVAAAVAAAQLRRAAVSIQCCFHCCYCTVPRYRFDSVHSRFTDPSLVAVIKEIKEEEEEGALDWWRYFRNVITAAVAVTTATSFVLTVLACFTGMRFIRMVYSYRIMPSCRRLLCFIVLMKMNDVMMYKIKIILV